MRAPENPVLRHARRLSLGRGWPLGLLALLFAAAGLGALIERHWMELPEYNLLAPPGPTRTLATTLLGETVLLLLWSAVRGAALWRRLERDGQIEEYRRSRLSPAAIVCGAWLAALTPPLIAVGASLLLAGAVAFTRAGLSVGEVVVVHGLLLTQTLAFGALGVWLSGRLRQPAFAIPLAVAALALVTGVLVVLDPLLPRLADPSPWIYAALLPNPVTAAAAALNTDVLRFGWLYDRLRTPEYFYVYPPAWQTAGCYLALTGGCLLGAVRRLRRRDG